jgi:hypothetical protein
MRSRFSRLAIPATLLTFAHCGSSTGPSDITGSWRTAASPGSRIELSLHGALNRITGTGQQYIVESLFDSLTVDGRWNGDGTFHLNLDFANTTPATYDGAFVGSNQLVGTMTRNGQSVPDVAFYRQAQ